ncbi:PREDICTED: galactosylceramide sulfotransferase-like [Priapulus caudatus]|uniref:Galactosylceramide sulfotransferase-like n=1 Tax=Priapulus caudatus TaxID=37621 RepID=A0ABM1DTV0_PRICU|nr:PREDICTED: galactosylceramide sulfotransferase-like [Priapulus caudatus]
MTLAATMGFGFARRVSAAALAFSVCLLLYAKWNMLRQNIQLQASVVTVAEVTRGFTTDATDADEADDRNRNCSAIHDVFFLKVHKCASSTLQNMFMRYGKRHKLTFVLPPRGNYVGYTSPLDASAIVRHPSGVYNMLVHHSRFELRSVRALMPRAVLTAVVRRPAAVFESLYHFSHWEQRFNVNLTTFLTDPRGFTARKHAKPGRSPPPRNSMLYDFGLPAEQFWNKTRIYETAQAVRATFDLVMLAERMEESLVLLRALLCWPWRDVVVLSANVRAAEAKRQSGGGGSGAMTAELAHSIETWNWGDAILYGVLADTFESRVAAYGRANMQRDLAVLRRVTRREHARCIAGTASNVEQTDARLRAYSDDVITFRLHELTDACVDLAKTELQFTNELREALLEDVRRHSRRTMT